MSPGKPKSLLEIITPLPLAGVVPYGVLGAVSQCYQGF